MNSGPSSDPTRYFACPSIATGGILCTYKDKVKLTFAKGAAVADPEGLFNASLEGKVRRAIDIHEGAQLDEQTFKALVQSAVALNTRT